MTRPVVTPHPKRIFLVFEGGGAKGIVHVGALRALEGNGLTIRGVAGTSAGAIVASLVAAGYSSHDMIGPDGRSPVLRSVGLEHATDFFGSDWGNLALVRWAVSDIPCALFLAALPCLAVAFSAYRWMDAGIAGAFLTFLAAFVVLAAWIAWRLARGVVRLDLLVEKLDLALRQKLQIDEPVYFRHLDAAGRPLRIIATDLASRKLKLFSSMETPDVRVAEAVAASAALPIACAHRLIANRRYIDGGIVSNLPAWTFDEERALDPDAVTIAVTIDGSAGTAEEEEMGPLRLMTAILRAAMFGRRHLEVRAAPRLLTLNLSTDIQVVDFDMTEERARVAVADAERAAAARIGERLFQLPTRFEQACSLVKEAVDEHARATAGDTSWRTRVLVALRDPGASASWRIQYGSGLHELDADDQLLLPEGSSIIGKAALAGAPVLQAHPFPPEMALSGPTNRYRAALVRPNLAWCLAIPMYRQPEEDLPIAIVAVDCDLDVKYFGFDEDVVMALAEAAQKLVQPVVVSALELDLDGSNDRPEATPVQRSEAHPAASRP